MTAEFELTVTLMSTETLCVLTVEPSWTLSHVKQLVQARLDSDRILKALIFGSLELQDEDVLSTAGLEETAMVTAVVVALPTLHLFKPCSARELSERRGCYRMWCCQGVSIVSEGVQHYSMEGVSPGTLEVVQEMAKAAPDLEITRVCGGESDENGEIIVISNPGDDPKKACFQALKFIDLVEDDVDLWKCTHLDERNWGEHLQCGFNINPKYQKRYQEFDAGLLAITKLMSEHLSRHFEIDFSEKIVVAPSIYGGYTDEGDIVAVLSGRVMT